MTLRINAETLAREGAVTLLTDYASDASIKLQIYRARPRSILPPCAFVDLMRETMVTFAGNVFQRTPIVEVVVIHGLFDSGEAVDQRDAFVDGFLPWCFDRPHAFSAGTIMTPTAVDDDPNYVPNWLPDAQQGPYYASRITLEGFAAT